MNLLDVDIEKVSTAAPGADACYLLCGVAALGGSGVGRGADGPARISWLQRLFNSRHLQISTSLLSLVEVGS